MTELKATRKAFWGNDYEITVDGHSLTRWDARTWRTGGAFELDGRGFEVRTNFLASRYELTDHSVGAEVAVAVAARAGRKHWKIEAESRTYEFERASFWRLEERLMIDGRPAGSIRRAHLQADETVATLPDLPRHVQVFALLVVLSGWDLAANA
jgi:hypothetical protein